MKYHYDKQNNKHSFQFLESSQKILIESLMDSKLLKNITICDSSYKKIEFIAENVYTLNEYLNIIKIKRGLSKLSYDECIQLAICIGKQLYYLENNCNNSSTFGMLEMDKIFVIDYGIIDSHIFIYLGEDLKTIQKNKITFTCPFSKNERNIFYSPEILAINNLPCSIDYRSVYYSLGSLISSCLISLDEIKMTKLYWFLMRCMNKDVTKRILLIL